jgi:cytochrome d ubiquinol oxidase subunit I
MDTALDVARLQFAFTITFHYLFPQLSMGLALLVFVLKTKALRSGGEHWDRAARFWTRILALSFVMGVATGIPMEFQFGTNWSRFAEAAGGVIGQTLAMEGMFAFFLESTFLGLLLFGESRLSRRAHWAVSGAVFAGAWLSGYFIVCTNAWMQHPVGYSLGPDGEILLASFWALLLNPWALWQYAHTMAGTVATAAFVMTGVGAYYVLGGQHVEDGRNFLRVAVPAGLIAALLLGFPTGDVQARMVARNQPAAFASMEGIFHTERDPGLVIVGQPDVENMRLDNPLVVPKILGFLTYSRFGMDVRGLADIPRDEWPDNVALHYYAYHVMVGLGTMFMGLMAVAALLLWRGRLFESTPLLWGLMLATPFPFIANTAGWMTTELGRQPWLIYGLMRTEVGNSPLVSAGNTLFTLIGFAGMYLVLGLLFLSLVAREIGRGPAAEAGGH